MTVDTYSGEIVQAAPTLPAKMEYARALAASNLLPPQYRDKPQNLLYAMEYADMLGVPPMTAVTGIHVINGQPSGSASLIASLVRRAGHKLRTERIQDGARTTIIRKDDPEFPHVVEFTMADAKLAGLLSNDNWRKRPAVMCEWRSITACARLACSEVLFGIAYTPDEIEETGVPTYTVTTAPARVTVEEILQGHDETPPTEPAPEETPAPEPPAVAMVTPPQLKKLHAALGEVGVKDRDAAHAWMSEHTGREIASAKDLTKDEASRLIDGLENPPPVVEDPPFDDQAWLGGDQS